MKILQFITSERRYEIDGAYLYSKADEGMQSVWFELSEIIKGNDFELISFLVIFGQNLLIALKYIEEVQLATYQTRLLHSVWMAEEDVEVKLTRLDLDAVWESLVTQVSGIVVADENSLDEQIAIEQEKKKLFRQIEDLEKKACKETQAKKKFELFQRLMEYWCNVMLGIFGSSLLTAITSLIGYFTERKTVMEEFYTETLKLFNQFNRYQHDLSLDLIHGILGCM